jgi:hypothetical protein
VALLMPTPDAVVPLLELHSCILHKANYRGLVLVGVEEFRDRKTRTEYPQAWWLGSFTLWPVLLPALSSTYSIRFPRFSLSATSVGIAGAVLDTRALGRLRRPGYDAFPCAVQSVATQPPRTRRCPCAPQVWQVLEVAFAATSMSSRTASIFGDPSARWTKVRSPVPV